MEKKYSFINGTARISVDKNIYSIESCMKASYVFIDKFYIFLHLSDNEILIDIKNKDKHKAVTDENIGEFYNELLNQSIREIIYFKTKGIREIIMARALHNSCIEDSESDYVLEEQSFNIERIAKDWFEEKYDE